MQKIKIKQSYMNKQKQRDICNPEQVFLLSEASIPLCSIVNCHQKLFGYLSRMLLIIPKHTYIFSFVFFSNGRIQRTLYRKRQKAQQVNIVQSWKPEYLDLHLSSLTYQFFELGHHSVYLQFIICNIGMTIGNISWNLLQRLSELIKDQYQLFSK